MGKTARRPGRTWLKVGGLGLLSLVTVMAALFGWLHSSSDTAFSQTSPYSLKWEVTDPPTGGRVGMLMTLPSVKITNTGTQTWTSSGNEDVRLGYRWFFSDGKPVPSTGETAWEDLRASLPSDIPPGGSIIFPDFQVSVPSKPDNYVLHLDLAQGATGWFATKGATDYSFKVAVAPKDTTAPTASVAFLPLFQVSTVFSVTWSGQDDKDGSGVATYDVQYKTFGENNWTDWLQDTPQTSAQFSGSNGKVYLFRARATDKAGNVGQFPDAEQASTHINILPPTSRVDTLPLASPTAFLVRWSGFDSVDGSDNQLFDVQYKDGDSGAWQDWQNATPGTAAVFKGLAGHSYYFRCRATNYAGLRSDFGEAYQANTTVNPVLDSLFSGAVPAETSLIANSGVPTASATPSLSATTAISNTTTPGPSVSGTLTATANTIPPSSPTGVVSPTVTATPAADGPQTSVFPLAVKNGNENLGTTGFVIENPGSEPLDLFVRFSDHNGAPISTTVAGVTTKTTPDQAQQASRVATVLVTVPAKGTKTIWAGNLPVAAYNGWVSISAGGPFKAVAIRLPKTGQPAEYIPAVPASTLYLPYFKKAGPVGSSYINLANPNTTPADVQITYYDATNGKVIAAKNYQVPMLGSLRFSTATLSTSNQISSTIEERFTGSAIISASVPLAASVELPQADGSYATYPAITKATDVAPQTIFYKDVNGFSTALIIQNTAKDQAAVKIEYFDASGVAVSTDTTTVPGYGSIIIGQDSLKDQKSFQGRARVSATNGTIAVVAIGGAGSLQAAGQQFP